MNVIAAYVIAKENENRKIADKTAQLYFEGMSYDEALKRARKIYSDHVKLKKNKDKRWYSSFK